MRSFPGGVGRSSAHACALRSRALVVSITDEDTMRKKPVSHFSGDWIRYPFSAWSQLHVESKNVALTKAKSDGCQGLRGWGKWGDGGQKGTKFQRGRMDMSGDLTDSMAALVNNTL